LAVILDTGPIVAAINADDQKHEEAVRLMKQLLKGLYGAVVVTDYVFDEAVTLALIRTGRLDLASDVESFLLDTPRIRLIHITPQDFISAWSIFTKKRRRPLSFTDCTTIAIAQRRHIKYVASYDRGFDPYLARLQ